MAQVGVIVVNDNINANAWIDQIKADNPKYSVGKMETTDKGVKYIPIDKNA